MLHCPIRQVVALLAAAWVSVDPVFADLLTLRQDGKYDHNNEITVCLSSDDAKKFSQTFEGANVYRTGCFPAKLGGFSPMYRVANIKMVTETEVFGFVYGISESVTPRTGGILHRVPGLHRDVRSRHRPKPEGSARRRPQLTHFTIDRERLSIRLSAGRNDWGGA